MALDDVKQLGFRILVIEVDVAIGANRNYLGEEVDESMLLEIEILERDRNVNLIGEFGEYHTFVVDCPIYKKSIRSPEAKPFGKRQRKF
jgi:diphthine-ammonia ligase